MRDRERGIERVEGGRDDWSGMEGFGRKEGEGVGRQLELWIILIIFVVFRVVLLSYSTDFEFAFHLSTSMVIT